MKNRSANEFHCGILGFYLLDMYFGRCGPFQKTNKMFVLTGMLIFLIRFF